jgi:hypothetical protein
VRYVITPRKVSPHQEIDFVVGFGRHRPLNIFEAECTGFYISGYMFDSVPVPEAIYWRSKSSFNNLYDIEIAESLMVDI